MGSMMFCGMDVHKESVTIAVLEGDGAEPVQVQRLPNENRRLRRFLERVAKRGTVKACYEASGAGYVLQRQLQQWGFACEVIAPSLIPVRPGEQRKHDRRDAIELARAYRAGQLVTIRIPSEAQEQVRDLVRCRQQLQQSVLRNRHWIHKFLRRRGLVYQGRSHWRRPHRQWLRKLLRDGSLTGTDQHVFTEYLTMLEYIEQRRDELDGRIAEIALEPGYRQPVAALRCLRGIDTLAAMVLVTEIGDFQRFDRPGQLMAYLGLIPSEHSSGDRRSLGPITKAGNSRCRHVLVQAAWHYRHRPAVGRELKARQRGQPPEIVAHAWKAQHRLFRIYHRLNARKHALVANVAVARELAGFVWGLMRLQTTTA